jgi:hypothetical protein
VTTEGLNLTQDLETVQDSYRDRIAHLQARHSEQLEKLAKAHATALERESDRQFPPVAQLDRHAQLQAQDENFDEARIARRQALATRDHICQDRKRQLVAEYEQARAGMLERHEAELLVFQKRQIDSLAEAYAKHRRQEAVLEKRINVVERKPKNTASTPRGSRTGSPRMSRTVSPRTWLWSGPALRKAPGADSHISPGTRG